MDGKVSLKDLAEHLGVSKTTVSWVLSDQGDSKGISHDTQKRIRDLAADLNYQPNYLARSLNKGTTGTIGLIVPSISDAFYSGIAREIAMEAEHFGYTVMMSSSEADVRREEKMIQMFKMKQVDGIILAPTKISKIEIEKLMEESYPFVLFDRYFTELDTNYVIIRNEQTSYEMVRHLIDKGCRKIALITTNPHLTIMSQRAEGYMKALQSAGIEPDKRLLGYVPIGDYESRLYDVMDEIYRAVPDVDGFFFTTHILALVAFNYFYERGIDIDRGRGFAALHCTPEFKVLAPEMSIAMMPLSEIGRSCVRILLDDIKTKLSKKPFVSRQQLSLPCSFELR